MLADPRPNFADSIIFLPPRILNLPCESSTQNRSQRMSQEEYRPAFDQPPGQNLAGIPISNLKLPNPDLSSGLRFYEACARHIKDTFHASKVYIVASKSLSSNTDNLDKLISAIGQDQVVGVRRGITPHTPWSEVLQITNECREAGADCVVTLGAGSITDGCKLVVLVCLVINHSYRVGL